MIYIFLFLAFIFLLQFFYSIKHKDNSIVDIFWGLSFVILVLGSYLIGQNFTLTHTLLTILVCMWGQRLSIHITLRKSKNFTQEDFRYSGMRQSWKYPITRSFFQVFCLQYLLASIIAGPIIYMNLSGSEGNILLTFLGVGLALLGLIYEVIADLQLKNFVKIKKKGEILTEGLRKYHRYPQYFGESMFWLGVGIITLQGTVFALISPILMFLLLRYVSGVPFLEHRYKDDKKFQEYSKITPVFFPRIK